MEKEITEFEELIQQIQTLMKVGKFAEGAKYAQKAIKLEPLNYQGYYCLGVCEASQQNLDSAKEAFENAKKIRKDIPEILYELGNVAFLKNEFEYGLQNYNEAIALGYETDELYFHLALVYEGRKSVGEALRYYTKASRMAPLNPLYLVRKANLQIQVSMFDQALETLEELHKVAPDSFEYYHMTSNMYVVRQQFGQAEEVLADALSRFPDDIDIMMDYIRVLVSQNKNEEALNWIETVAERTENQTVQQKLMLYQGQIALISENIPLSIDCMKNGLLLDGDKSTRCELLYNLMNTCVMIKDYDAVYDYASQLADENSDEGFALCAPYYKALAKKLNNAPDYKHYYDEAIRYYRKLALGEKSRLETYIFRAMCCKDIGDFNKALDHINYVIALLPDNGDVYLIRSNILAEIPGKSKQAEEDRAKAKELGATTLSIGGLGNG